MCSVFILISFCLLNISWFQLTYFSRTLHDITFRQMALFSKNIFKTFSIKKEHAMGLQVLTLSPQKTLIFMCVQYKSFENIVRKREIARNGQFVLFP